MGIKSTIFKVELNISDMDRNYYHEHKLTIALHPSETETRMMARMLAFILNANENLLYSKCVNRDDEPDIWQNDLTGTVELWIYIGQPEEKRIRKACNRAKDVIIYTYNGESSTTWWKQKSNKLIRFKNLLVVDLPVDAITELVTMIDRTMEFQCTIQDGHIWIANKDKTVEVDPVVRREQNGQ